MAFTEQQECCSSCKSKDNEEIWKMGKLGNSTEVMLMRSPCFDIESAYVCIWEIMFLSLSTYGTLKFQL